MPARRTDKVEVVCPHCGHRQAEPRAAISTNCRKCREYFRVRDEAPGPAPRPAPAAAAADVRRIRCFECGTELEVPRSAESTMCKRCSRYVDLKDYRIDHAVSKNFKTKGTFVIESKGYVFNTETVAEHAVIKGRFLGTLDVHGSLTLHSGAEIKGRFKTSKLIIPAGHHFAWPDRIRLDALDAAGELVASVTVRELAQLRATARFFGDLEARHLAVEEGAVLVGSLQIRAEPAR